MGCNLKDLAPTKTITLSDLSGQRVGIDAFLTAFQFLTTLRDRSPQGDGGPLRDSNGNPTSHLMGFFHRTATLLSLGIRPIYIFDGESPELKADELAARTQRRLEAEAIHKEAMAAGDFPLAQKMAQRIMHYSPVMVEETQRLLDLLGVPYVTAAAEGEAQAAAMAAKGQLDVVATQDWDALLYGAPRLVRNLMDEGTKRYGRVINAEEINLEAMLNQLDVSQDQLVDLGIMIGTDFYPGVKGIGPKTGLKLIKQHGTMEAVCAVKEQPVPDNLADIRTIFHDHPVVEVDDESLVQGDVDREGLIQFLQHEREFSQRRMNQAFEKLEQSGLMREKGQSTLFSFGS